MWLPRTRRTASPEGWFRVPFSTRFTHGPAALTIALASTSSPFERRARQPSFNRFAATHSTPVRTRAPSLRASLAFATTSRASSTRQSE